MERRQQAEQDAGGDRYRKGEAQHAGIEKAGDELETGGFAGFGQQQMDSPPGDEQAGQSAQHGEHGAFGEQLADDAAARGADGEANRDFLRARSRARHEKAGDVGAGDQQHHAGHGHQRRERRFERAAQPGSAAMAVFQGYGSLPPAVVAGRLRSHAGDVLLELGQIVRPQLGRGLLAGYSRLEASVEVEDMGASRVEGGAVSDDLREHGGRNDDVDRSADVQTIEASLADSDDGEGVAVEANGLADDVGSAAKLFDPETVSEHGDGVAAADAIVLGGKHAADERPDAEHLEIVATDDRLGDPARGAVDGEIDRLGAFGQQAGEDLLLIAEPSVGRVGPAPLTRHPAVADSLGIENDQLAGALDRQRFEQDLVHEAEHRGVGADAESQRQQSHGGEGGVFQQRAPGVADVPQKLLDELGSSHVATLLFALLEAVHGAQGGATRLFGGGAPGDLFLGSPLDVVTDLVL